MLTRKTLLLVIGSFVLIGISVLTFLSKGRSEFAIHGTHQRELERFHTTIIQNTEQNGGLAKSKFGMLLQIHGKDTVYYTHHPTLYTVILYNGYRIFGPGIYTVFPLLISVLIVLSIFIFLSQNVSPSVAFWSAMFVISHRLFIRYSMFINYDPLTLLLAIHIFWQVHRSIKRHSEIFTPTLILLLLISMFTDWPGYFMYLYIFIYVYTIRQKPSFNRKFIVLAAIPFVAFSVFLLHTSVLTGSLNGGNLYRTFIGRISNVGEVDFFGGIRATRPGYSTAWEFIVFLVQNMWKHLGAIYLVAFGLYVQAIVRMQIRKRSISSLFVPFSIVSLTIVGIAYLLVFNSFAYNHDFSLLQLVPSVAMSLAIMIGVVVRIVLRVNTHDSNGVDSVSYTVLYNVMALCMFVFLYSNIVL